MTNIKQALCVAFNLRIPAREYHNQPQLDVDKFFTEHGSVTRQNTAVPVDPTSTPTTEVPAAEQPQAKWQKGKAFMPSTKNVWLAEFFNELVKRDWHVFSSHENELGETVTLKFMMCPRAEVEWDRKRPYDDMQAALGLAVTLATFRTLGYDNPYTNPEDSREGMRALVINGDQPDWIFQPDGQPKKDLRERVAKSLLVYADGEVGF